MFKKNALKCFGVMKRGEEESERELENSYKKNFLISISKRLPNREQWK